jgi:hypothetical protein
VIEFRNDTGSTTAAAYQRALETIAAGALQFAEHVLIMTPPPQANAGLTAWDAADPYQTGGYQVAAAAAAAAVNAYYYDAVGTFQALTAAGTYTVAQLMRDTIHPTDASLTSAGMGQLVNAIVVGCNNPNVVHTPGSARPFARLGAQVNSGTWTWTEYTSTTGPAWDAQSLSAPTYRSGRTHALQATAAGQLTVTTPACTQIGLIGLVDQTTAGQVDVSVDGGAAVRLDLSGSGVTNYSKGYWVATGLANTTHTVTIDWVSGTARVVGVVGA